MRQLCAKFCKFWAKIHREMICQSWLLLTPFFNLTIVQCIAVLLHKLLVAILAFKYSHVYKNFQRKWTVNTITNHSDYFRWLPQFNLQKRKHPLYGAYGADRPRNRSIRQLLIRHYLLLMSESSGVQKSSATYWLS